MDVPDRYRYMYDRAMSGRSRRTAIRLHCLMCMGWKQSDVPKCTATGCPLYPYRSGTAKDPNNKGLAYRGANESAEVGD
jgi:hypothetical protein